MHIFYCNLQIFCILGSRPPWSPKSVVVLHWCIGGFKWLRSHGHVNRLIWKCSTTRADSVYLPSGCESKSMDTVPAIAYATTKRGDMMYVAVTTSSVSASQWRCELDVTPTATTPPYTRHDTHGVMSACLTAAATWLNKQATTRHSWQSAKVWYGLTSHSTHYRSFWRRFYGSYDPTNSVIALKDDG